MIPPDEKIYIMEKFVMNRDFPDPTDNWGDGRRVIQPYHNGWYMIATEPEARPGGIGTDIEFDDDVDDGLGKLIDFLRHYSGTHRIVNARHPCFPEEVDIEGDLEKYRELLWGDLQKVKAGGIRIDEE